MPTEYPIVLQNVKILMAVNTFLSIYTKVGVIVICLLQKVKIVKKDGRKIHTILMSWMKVSWNIYKLMLVILFIKTILY